MKQPLVQHSHPPRSLTYCFNRNEKMVLNGTFLPQNTHFYKEKTAINNYT